MTERCAFSEMVVSHSQPGEHVLYCGNPMCTAVFTVNGDSFQLVEGTPRCKFVSEEIKEIRKILKYFENLSPVKREELDMQLKDLENEFNHFGLSPENVEVIGNT